MKEQIRAVVKEELAKLPAGVAGPTVDAIWSKPIKSELTNQDEPAWRTLQAVNTKVFGGTPSPAPTPTPTPSVPTYTVVAGDTLGGIAKKFNVTVADLVAWNGLANPDAIEVGQVLRVGKA
jgi:LysM repeat protein